MKKSSYIRPKAKKKPETVKVAVPASNVFILNFNVEQDKEGKLKVSKSPFSFDAQQFPALMEENGKDLSQLGVDVLGNVLANCIARIADLHEETTGTPASKTKERVISKLEVGKRVKLIGV